jgi:hypothetical protein
VSGAVTVRDTNRNPGPISQQEHKPAETVTVAVNYVVRPVLFEESGELWSINPRFAMSRTVQDT